MSTVGVKELKNRLTYYLRQAKNGEEVIVTERDTPIALIQRIEAVTEPVSLEARLAKAAAEGFITLPTRKLRSRVQRVAAKGRTSLAQTIIKDREDRF